MTGHDLVAQYAQHCQTLNLESARLDSWSVELWPGASRAKIWFWPLGEEKWPQRWKSEHFRNSRFAVLQKIDLVASSVPGATRSKDFFATKRAMSPHFMHCGGYIERFSPIIPVYKERINPPPPMKPTISSIRRECEARS